MKTVEFEYEIGQDVRVKPLNVTGIVLARCDRGTYLEYRVIYWWEGVRKDDWLTSREVESTKR